MLLYTSVLAALFGSFLAWRFISFVQNRQYWTLALGLSVLQPYLSGLSLSLLSYIALYDMWLKTQEIPEKDAKSLVGPMGHWLIHMTTGFKEEGRPVILPYAWIFNVALLLLCIDYSIRNLQNYSYVRLRWKAWIGPSRTGISPALLPYIGNRRDWKSLSGTIGNVKCHPVERFLFLFSPLGGLILSDPTVILPARAAIDRTREKPWEPRSQLRDGLYEPVLANQPASLLWGERLGFQKRCSRGIISVPPTLLQLWPVIKGGLSGKSICLAYGILARNKGLEPRSLVCNLMKKHSYGKFEESSLLWPRPAKTLRSTYRREFDRTFSVLGDSYVTAATELALLLEDSSQTLIADWLDGCMEHQDLLLNNTVHAVGASADELQRLYRGHYAAMLISLSAHKQGCRVRPELTVFSAVCRLEGALPPPWLSHRNMQARRDRELQDYGSVLLPLIESVV